MKAQAEANEFIYHKLKQAQLDEDIAIEFTNLANLPTYSTELLSLSTESEAEEPLADT